METFRTKKEEAVAAAKELIAENKNVKVLKLTTVVRSDSDDFATMKEAKRIPVDTFTEQGVSFTIVLN